MLIKNKCIHLCCCYSLYPIKSVLKMFAHFIDTYYIIQYTSIVYCAGLSMINSLMTWGKARFIHGWIRLGKFHQGITVHVLLLLLSSFSVFPNMKLQVCQSRLLTQHVCMYVLLLLSVFFCILFFKVFIILKNRLHNSLHSSTLNDTDVCWVRLDMCTYTDPTTFMVCPLWFLFSTKDISST